MKKIPQPLSAPKAKIQPKKTDEPPPRRPQFSGIPNLKIPTPLDIKNALGKINSPENKKQKKFWKLGIGQFNTHVFDINPDGELIVKEGNYVYDVHEIVKKYGSPIELFFPHIAKERLDDLISIFNFYMKIFHFRGKFSYHYPMKVNQNKEFVLPLVGQGANLEVSSYNELCMVKKMWEHENFNANIRVLCNGPKSPQYIALIEEMLAHNLRVIPIIEDMQEYNILKNFRGDVGIRVDIGVDVDSHWDKKVNRFGVLPQEIFSLGKIKNLRILHYHVASEIHQASHLFESLKKAMQIYVRLQRQCPTLNTIDIGGGMPVPYARKSVVSAESLIRKMIKYLIHFCDKKKIQHPDLICEWGRYVVAPSQISVFQVISVKDIPKGSAKKWYIINGSFINDLLDTWAIHQKWHLVPVNHLNAKKFHRVWLAGISCDTDDIYTANGTYVLLPRLEDLTEGEKLSIAVLDTGAYQDSLATHHCLLSSPAKITLSNGEAKLVRRRETPEDVGKLFGW